VFYGVDLARFNDSNADGYGDFKGLTRKLDYLQWLGIDAIWLLPFYRSPREDAGYDVVDHYEIDPRLGTTGDFVAFLREAEHRNIHVLIDLVINHTSSQHRWFQESLQAGSAKRGWYIWTDDLESVPDYPVVFPHQHRHPVPPRSIAGARPLWLRMVGAIERTDFLATVRDGIDGK
jgi:maltose alpha-D-glucosyltransferase/alpha-amylase